VLWGSLCKDIFPMIADSTIAIALRIISIMVKVISLAFRKILVPYDQSKYAEKALNNAINLAVAEV
jgi:hypothetical protein